MIAWASTQHAVKGTGAWVEWPRVVGEGGMKREPFWAHCRPERESGRDVNKGKQDRGIGVEKRRGDVFSKRKVEQRPEI
jgi:hypothetical protein